MSEDEKKHCIVHIDSITITRGGDEVFPRSLSRRSLGPIDYTKIDPAELSENFQDIEKRMIREFIKAHPEMGPMEIQKALLEAKGYEVSYQVIRGQREKE